MSPEQPLNERLAIEAAVRLTRLDELSRRISAERITISQSKIPFLWKELKGRRAWQVKFEGAGLRLKSALPGFQDRYRRNFVALILEATGHLVSVYSTFEGDPGEMRPEPPGESADRQLRGEQEIYVGWPPADPKIPFLDALDIVLTKGGGSPFLAKEIEGVFVMESRMGSAPRAVWAITLRGLPPMMLDSRYGDTVPEWQRNHMRTVIDATTGQSLFATNTPQPE